MRWLIDEMMPPRTAEELRTRGHDAVSVHDLELAGRPDPEILARAIAEERVVVTENFADYAGLLEQLLADEAPCVPVAFVPKTRLRTGRAMASDLAERLHRWAKEHPEPFVGPHWP